MIKVLVSLMVMMTLFVAAPVLADEIEEQLQTAIELYKEGNITEALEELEFATAQLRQKKAENMGDLFPEPLAGWKAEEFESQSLGRAAFGGGITASRHYTKDGGGETVIEVISDSPMMQTMGMLINNPALIGASKDTKLIRIKRQKALLKTEGKNRAELTFLVENKVLVQIEVNGIADAADVAKAYAKKLDFKKLKKLTL